MADCRMTFLFLVLMFFGAAHANENSDAVSDTAQDFLTSRPMLLGAHRGGKNEWPENTVYALKAAAERWPDILLEIDVCGTADGRVVVLHDIDVNRTTDGSGFVGMMTLEKIRSLDAAYHFSPDGGQTFPYRGQGFRIPTLEEALSAAPDHRFLIEIKDGAAAAQAAAEAIQQAGAAHRCIIASVNPMILEEFRGYAPEVATCYDILSASDLLGALRGGDWEGYKPQHRMLALSPSLKRRFEMTPEEIRKIREKGILVSFFTINDTEEMHRILDLEPDSILTDLPSILAEVIAQRNGGAGEGK